jgi:hypothetical protein
LTQQIQILSKQMPRAPARGVFFARKYVVDRYHGRPLSGLANRKAIDEAPEKQRHNGTAKQTDVASNCGLNQCIAAVDHDRGARHEAGRVTGQIDR